MSNSSIVFCLHSVVFVNVRACVRVYACLCAFHYIFIYWHKCRVCVFSAANLCFMCDRWSHINLYKFIFHSVEQNVCMFKWLSFGFNPKSISHFVCMSCSPWAKRAEKYTPNWQLIAPPMPMPIPNTNHQFQWKLWLLNYSMEIFAIITVYVACTGTHQAIVFNICGCFRIHFVI